MKRRSRGLRVDRASCAALIVGAVCPAALAVTSIFQITSFANPPALLEYPTGFSGTVGTTEVWPAEMGWQGNRIDIAFALPANPPVTARNYRFRVVITQQFTQSFDLAILAGPALGDLEEIHREHVDTARVFVATIPLNRFVPGQTNYIRIQGDGVQVGGGQPPGIQWSRWALSRTDTTEDADPLLFGQLQRLTQYTIDAILPNGLVRDALPYQPGATPFHPATPDAAGFALLSLCAADELGLLADAAARVETILRTYSGNRPGLAPARNVRGHWWHWMDVNTGQPAAGWGDNYTTIGSALLVSGALFAKNHFIENSTIATYVDQMRLSTDFDSAINPSLNGSVALATNAAGGHLGYVSPWNEYMLIVSLALRQSNNTRAQAIAWRWLDPANAPRRHYPSFTTDLPTLTDNVNSYAPAFWVQQQYFFNADFSTHPGFLAFFRNHRTVDSLYCAANLTQGYRYGLTAGVSPSGYTVDRVFAHQNVFSPEAVGAWGDLDTLLEFAQDQPPLGHPRYRYGLVRVSSAQPTWIPSDGALVDHLFLMFGLIESLDPLFFKRRQAFQADADADGIADAYDNCASTWNPRQQDENGDGVGDACACSSPTADVDGDGDVDLLDFAALQRCPAGGSATNEGCLCLDRDEDHQITIADVAGFFACWNESGPDVVAPDDCGD